MQQEKTVSDLGKRLLTTLLAIVFVVGLAPTVPASQALAESTVPFTASIGTTAIYTADIACTAGGYSYTPYGATAPTAVDLYTITVPQGTTEATVDLGTVASLAYYYDQAGAYLDSVDKTVDSYVGATHYTLKVDCNADGANDYVFIQNPYAVDNTGATPVYSGGELRFVITFAEADAAPTDPTTPETASNAGAYTADKANTLISNLNTRFSKNGKNAAITKNTFLAALALCDQDMATSIDTAKLLEALGSKDTLNSGELAKFIIALDAAGLDCTSLTDAQGVTRNLIEEMMTASDYETANLYYKVYILPAIDLADKGTVEQAKTDALVKSITDAQDEESGLFDGGYGVDAQTTAQAVLALATHDATGNKDAIDKAITGLKANQGTDGGFIYSTTYGSTSDVDTTATAVAALAACGIDPASIKTADGTTPLDYLVAVADASLDGYETASSYDESMSASTALLGLVANLGFNTAGGAFNVYTDVIVNEATPVVDTTTKTSTTAKTSDASMPLTAEAGTLATCALAAYITLRRKFDK